MPLARLNSCGVFTANVQQIVVPIPKSLDCATTIRLAHDSKGLYHFGWHASIGSGGQSFSPAPKWNCYSASRQTALALAIRQILNAFERGLTDRTNSKAEQTNVGRAITHLAAFRDQVDAGHVYAGRLTADCEAENQTEEEESMKKPPPVHRQARNGVKSNGRAGDPTAPFIIDPEFAALLPVLADDEELTASINSQGCQQALTVWPQAKGKPLLVDGHRRFRVCSRLGKPYQIKHKSFASREEAKDWMIREQLARRNVTPAEASYLRGKLYLREKKETGKGERKRKVAETQSRNGETNGHDRETNGASVTPLKPIPTAVKIARQTGVSPRTIKRDATFAAAIDRLPVEKKAAALAGKATKAEVTGRQNNGRQNHPATDHSANPAKSADAWRAAWLRSLVSDALKVCSAESVDRCIGALSIAVDARWEMLNPDRRREYLMLLPEDELRDFAELTTIFPSPAASDGKRKIVNLILLTDERRTPRLPPGLNVPAKRRVAK